MASMREAQGELAARQIHRLATKPRDKTVAAPQFDIAAIDKTPGSLDRLGIIGAQQRLEPYKMPIKPNGIKPVFCQLQSPPQNIRGAIAFTDLWQCLPGTGLGNPMACEQSASESRRLTPCP
jgi:hypothetical protein